MLAIEFSPGGPNHYHQWHHDPNRDGSDRELADNRRILASLKAWLEQRHPTGPHPGPMDRPGSRRRGNQCSSTTEPRWIMGP